MKPKPCPWCRGDASISFDDTGMPRWVWCPECEADGPPLPHTFNGTAEEALRYVVDAWNTRVADAENERLRGVIEDLIVVSGEWLDWHRDTSPPPAPRKDSAIKRLEYVWSRCREALEGTK